MAIQFHLDENVNGAIANGLRLRGIDVTTSKDAELIGASDEGQIAFAHESGRVLVTHDDDLLRLSAEGVEHAGIAYCHPRKNSIGQNILSLMRLWRTTDAEDMWNQVVFL